MTSVKGKKHGKTRHTASPSLLSTATREQASQYTMLQSITTGTFEDVKFYLFSRRRGTSGFVHAPRPLYANSALICKASSHFNLVLSDGFSESAEADLNAPYPPNRKSFTRSYDYALDSDLEDGSEDEVENKPVEWGHVPPAPTSILTNISRGPSSVVVDTRPPSPMGEGPGEEAPVPEPETDFIPPGPYLCDSGPASVVEGLKHPDDVGTPSPTLARETPRKGHVVFIEDIAYRTWEAFIFYAYFGRVSFAPLTSRGSSSSPPSPPDPFSPPPCSPKSMYRLADKYGIDDLKQLALNDLVNKLTYYNILTELFSSFTLTYPGVQAEELQRLRYEFITQDILLQAIPKWLEALEKGILPRGSAALFSRMLTGVASNGRLGW